MREEILSMLDLGFKLSSLQQLFINPVPKNIFLDQDDTLGMFLTTGSTFFPGTREFLTNQQNRADLYLASTGSQPVCEENMAELRDIFTGIFGREKIGTNAIDTLFLDQDGWPKFVETHYAKRIDLMREERRRELEEALSRRNEVLTRLEGQRMRSTDEYMANEREFARLQRFSERLLHRETGKPFDENSRYENPHLEGNHKKDLHLARRWIAGSKYDELHAVMIGDNNDKGANLSDPRTPVIVISNAVREGNWFLLENILEVILHSSQDEPARVYDGIYFASSSSGDRRSVVIGGIHYVFEVEKFRDVSSRRVYCP